MQKTAINPSSPDSIDLYVGKRLRFRRSMLKMSQDQLATLVGVTFQQIQKYENGTNRISASRLYKISEALNVSIHFFFDGLEEAIPSENKKYTNKEKSKNKYQIQEEKRKFDPMFDTETLELIAAFQKVTNPKDKDKILKLILAISNK